MSGNGKVLETFGTAKDLPHVRELERQIDGLRLVRFLLKPSQRKQLEKIRSEISALSDIVDKFYNLLGPRNWVFHDDLNTQSMREVISMETPEQAERRLIDYYQGGESLDVLVRQLWRVEALRPRQDLINRASEDYRAGRYYSTVLVLIAVMDGAVNDLEPHNRRGLHAREDYEMVAWGSVTAHHLGLKNAHRSFTKDFKKTVTEEVTELHRHGIVHGMIVNYDNVVVATKAFNRLFAVADWATNLIEAKKIKVPEPTFGEVLRKIGQGARDKKVLESFTPYERKIKDATECDDEVVKVAHRFLESWTRRNYLEVSEHFMTMGEPEAASSRAKQAKELYKDFNLEKHTVVKVRHLTAVLALIDVQLQINNNIHLAELRWIRQGDDGDLAVPGRTGNWRLSPYGPTVFIKQ